MLTLIAMELINHVSPWYALYHFTFVSYSLHYSNDLLFLLLAVIVLTVNIFSQRQLKGLDDTQVMLILRGED